MSIQIKSFNQILGEMIRKIIADTPLNDINTGSVLLTLLEAAAANDFENNTAILNVLELLNIDALKNNDLDARAADFGLSRQPAVRASGTVTIMNTNIVKRSTGLYVIKPAPIAGQTTLYVNDTTGWAPTGSLYIGRGTENFEGPINYTSITQYPTYSEITLASALQKDHLISEIVIDSQGEPDRLISAGTIVKVPANNQNPEIQYATLRDAVIPAGEDMVEGVEVVALVPGSIGNAGINTITQFDTLPFPGAAVTNTTAFSNGRDIESDVQLRNRIKSYAITLARGTAPSIISAVVGVSDPDDSKQVASAVLTEPVKVGDPSILYIDDGSGFQPSYTGQSVDVLLDNAQGSEEFLQLSNFPVPRPQVVNVESGPFNVPDGSFLRVIVDGKEETVYFSSSQFLNTSAATLAEIVVAINSSSTLFKARFTNNSRNILLYPTSHDAETIQVSPMRSTDNPLLYINSVLKFPTDEFSYISLYQNSTRLKEKARSAELTTTPYAQWNINSAGNIIISVDGTPAQDRTFALSDFSGASSFSSLTLQDWVYVFNAKFAGVTAEATPSQTMVIRSNKTGDQSQLTIVGGSLFSKWFANLPTHSRGQTAQFELNRQTGNLRILTEIKPGDTISAGAEDTKGFVVSTPTNSGIYNFSSDSAGRPAEMVVVVDSTFCNQKSVPLLVGSTIDVSAPNSTTMRLMSSTADAFAYLKPGDYVYIVRRSSAWFNTANTGLFRIKAKGSHTTAGVDTFIDVNNSITVPETGITVVDALDIKAFETDGYPQVWRGSYLANPPAEPIDGVIQSLNRDLINVRAVLQGTNAIKITSTTERGGSIAIPVSVSSASLVFPETVSAQFGNPPHVATRISTKSLFSIFKRTQPTDTNVFLDRYTYSDRKSSLAASSIPDAPPFTGTYSEVIDPASLSTSTDVDFDDYISFTRGSNKGQIRTVKAKVGANSIGTQQDTARTELQHVLGDEVQLVEPISISADDSVVFVMDRDPSIKTIDVKMSRTGRVNSGSGSSSFIPTTTEFSAFDHDNEPGIDFSNLNVWGKNINNTEFADYAVWMRARNWYSTDGVAGSGGKMLVRASQYGPNGEKIRFSIQHPSFPDQQPTTSYVNTPSWSRFTYFFGSGSARAVGLSAGDTIAVQGPYPDDTTNFPNGPTSPTGNYYDYTFSGGNLSSVLVGDVLSIIPGSSGVSNQNCGQFRVANKSGFTVRVFNPNASTTSPGSPEIVTVNTVADVVGTPTIYDVSTVADVAGSLHMTYFIIYDTQGSVAVWYDVGNTNTPPPPHGANRSIKVATVVANDSANDVATKTAQVIAMDNAFTVGVIGNNITITNNINGTLPSGSAATSGFTVTTTPGTPDNSLNGRYFIIHDDDGSVAVWYSVGNSSINEPFHGADRSIKVTGVMPGDSAATVAAATAAAINPDLKFSATASGNTVTITASFDGNLPPPSAGTSGFTVSSVDGSLSTAELITNSSGVMFFPINGTDVATIASTVNSKQILEITPISPPTNTIERATVEEDYAYGGDPTALGYGHNPNIPALRDHIKLYDAVNWVKTFQNSNPNFTMKRPYLLNGVAPSVYQMNTAPNSGTSLLGELFKLIPTTVKNVHHHLTQKALSQLPIVANVRISSDRKNVQVTSKRLGSAGAIEVVGGNANRAKAYILTESEVAIDGSGKHLLVKIPAFPDTFNAGDYVRIENDAGVKRLSRLSTTDSIDVTNPSTGVIYYNYNPKTTNISATTQFTITDVSGLYGRPAGFVWRWTHDGSATLAQVKPGDQVMAFGPTLSWSQGNKARTPGGGLIAGLPIIAVNDVANYFDVLNPYGKQMSTPTAVGAGNTVQICPAPAVKWNLAHAARVKITSMSRTGSTVTVTCAGEHLLNTGDSVDISNSDNIPDGTYTSVTVLSNNQFTFTLAGPSFTEGDVGASAIRTGLVPTRYRIEKLGINNLVRISRHDGESPRFVDCGVAVDDYVIIGGTTFTANNSGRFRVLAVDNDSIIVENPSATEQLDTLRQFNDKGLNASWTANTNIVTGVAGTFKNINVGDWVKKPEDPDSYYRQVVSMTPSSPSLATQITLGGNYPGSTSQSMGIAYNQLVDHDKGVVLQDHSDIVVLEGDAALPGDTLFVQNIVHVSWFSPNNIGSFEILDVGTDPTTYKPFLRINNPAGISESNRLMSVDAAGFYIVESLANKFYSIRQIQHVAIDDLNPERRSLYLTPSSRSYKFSDANHTSVTHMGKLGYSTDVTIGIDGYLYYTGLLRRVQRIIDGYEPDAQTFPGRRAVGSAIEILPPLIRKIKISLDITTNEGVNLGEISNNIKSVIINYVQTLGVGQDVILSEIIAAVMQIKGVEAVTFTNPAPSTERITIANNEKATISPEDIGLA